MGRSLATALAVGVALTAFAGPRAAFAQAPPSQCADFVKLRDDTGKKAAAVRMATDHHAPRKEICTLVTRFVAAEGVMLKFLEDNKTWCGVPDQVINVSKANHEKSIKFRTVACTEAPAGQPKVPTLSDAIGTPSVDTAKNTKTGRGTLDTLTGNPLAK